MVCLKHTVKGKYFAKTKTLLQAKQAEQARKIAAQQQLETIDLEWQRRYR